MMTEIDIELPFYLRSLGTREEQEHIFRPEGYPDYHWLHCTKGEGRLILENREYVLGEGDGFFMCPGVPHEYYAVREPWETQYITFNGWACERIIGLLGLKKYKVFTNLNTARLDQVLDEIYESEKRGGHFSNYESSHLVYKFIVSLNDCTLNFSGTGSSLLNRLQPAVEYIEKNYSTAISLADMAQKTGVTPRHFCRIFKQAFKMSPFDYLTAYRIKRAKEILISMPDVTVSEVGKMVGYNSTSYFVSVFKSVENITPLEFRRMNRFPGHT